MKRSLAYAVVVLVAGCTPTVTPPPSQEAPAQPQATTPPVEPKLGADVQEIPTAELADPERWRCAKDEDCAQTCALGAVSAAWLAQHQDADDCDDGCGWQSGKQACRDEQCVTLAADGTIDETCTRRDVKLYAR